MKIELTGVQEHRDIRISSKRQFTIPKSFFDALNMEDEVQAFLLEDGIFLKPIRTGETVYEYDVQAIVRKALDEGLSGENLVKEITSRIYEYDLLISDRVHEFTEDMKSASASEENEGDLDFNGLDVFFDKEDEET